MFHISPDREPEPRRAPVDPPRLPWSEPPRPPRTWWETVPGTIAIVAMAVGVLMIAGVLTGVIDIY